MLSRYVNVGILSAFLAACQTIPNPSELGQDARVSVRRASPSAALLPRALVLEGLAEVSGEAFARANIQAFDLTTGSPLGSGGQTDAKGQFTWRLPVDTTPRLVKLVASREGQALATVIDARDVRAISSLLSDRGGSLISNNGGSLAAAQGYRLAQEDADLTLRLDTSTTATAQALAGSFKAQLGTLGIAASLDPAFDVANRTARKLQGALATAPVLAKRLTTTVGSDGRLQDVSAFRQVLTDLRVNNAVTDAVHEMLNAATTQPKAPDALPVALSQEDFPVGDVTVTDGAISFRTRDGETAQGTVATPAPTPAPGATRTPASPAPTVTPSAPPRGERIVSSIPEEGPGALFNGPSGVTVDSAGTVYVAERANHRIRKITPAGVVSTLAGDGTAGFADGPGAIARFNRPTDVAVDNAGNLYVSDIGNQRVRKITPAGVVSTLAGDGTAGFADGPGATARFNVPVGVAVDAAGNVYVGEEMNDRIRKITPQGVVSTLAGNGTRGFVDGPAAVAQFSSPEDVAVDRSGNVYVADEGNHRIRKITPAGVVSTLAGNGTLAFRNGTGAAARFASPQRVAVDAAGNVYVTDEVRPRVRKVSPAGVVTTLAGDGTAGFVDGPGATARLNSPSGVGVDATGNVYVADVNNHRIRKITSAGVVSTLAGSNPGFADGPVTTPLFNDPEGVAVDAAGNLYVADSGNHRIQKVSPAGAITTLAGDGTAGFADGPGTTARFNAPEAVAVDTAGNVYVADQSNHRIRKITPAGVVSTLAGDGTAGFADGPGATARFNSPNGVAVDGAGNVYVGDTTNYRVRKITPAGVVSTLAGDGTAGIADGPGATARFNAPSRVGVDAAGSVYVGDGTNHRIRKITPAGVVSTLAGDGTAGFVDGPGATARFNGPQSVAVDAAGNVYVADELNHRIRMITPAGVVSTIAGDGTAGFVNGPGSAARFAGPQGVAVDAAGNVFVTDDGNNVLRRIR